MTVICRFVQWACGYIFASFFCGLLSFPSFAQIPIGVQPVSISHLHPSFGIESGFELNTQLGSYYSSYMGGTGTGWAASLFFSLPFGEDFDIGLKAGYDRKDIISSVIDTEAMVVVAETQSFTMQIPIKRTGSVSGSFVRIEPYVEYQILTSDFFIQIGAGFYNLIQSEIIQTRTIENTTVRTPDGSQINNLTFTNSSTTQAEQNSEIPAATGWRCSAIFAAGYNIDIGNIRLAPLVTYDYPFSNIGSHNSSNWKITSFYGSIALSLE